MNKVVLLGRLTKDPEVRTSQGSEPITIARYTLAVDRRGRKNGDQPTADFISCVAFRQNAEFAEKYLQKGMKIAVCGRIQTGSYTNRDGQKVYTTEVVVEEHDFCEKRSDSGQKAAAAQAPTPSETADGFMNIPDGIDDELPWN